MKRAPPKTPNLEPQTLTQRAPHCFLGLLKRPGLEPSSLERPCLSSPKGLLFETTTVITFPNVSKVAIATEVSNSSTNSLAIADLLAADLIARNSQLTNYWENPPARNTPPFAVPRRRAHPAGADPRRNQWFKNKSGWRKRGVKFKGVAVTTETATTAETAKTVKTVTVVSWHCIL